VYQLPDDRRGRTLPNSFYWDRLTLILKADKNYQFVFLIRSKNPQQYIGKLNLAIYKKNNIIDKLGSS
jgi:hypothetical protein